ncbi:hypothetical protein K438DRAFT_1775419 [Mycena galopus ATCC 62051]|nr:hypothetical protein K438DRAFT_1775419 [Mycena galopus ATCC 62051]
MIPSRLDYRCRHTGPESVGVAGGIFDPRPTTVQTKYYPQTPEPSLPPPLPREHWCHGSQRRLESSYFPDKNKSQLLLRMNFNMISNHLNHPCRCPDPESVSVASGIINLRPHVVESVIHTLYVCFALYRNSLLIFPYKSSPPAIRVPQQHPLVTKLAQLEKEVKERLKKKDVQKEEAEYRPPWVNPGLVTACNTLGAELEWKIDSCVLHVPSFDSKRKHKFADRLAPGEIKWSRRNDEGGFPEAIVEIGQDWIREISVSQKKAKRLETVLRAPENGFQKRWGVVAQRRVTLCQRVVGVKPEESRSSHRVTRTDDVLPDSAKSVAQNLSCLNLATRLKGSNYTGEKYLQTRIAGSAPIADIFDPQALYKIMVVKYQPMANPVNN